MAVRDNLLPMAVLSSFALMLMALYLGVPNVRHALGPLRVLMAEHCAVGAFLSMLIFAGLIPWIFFLVDRSIRPVHPGVTGVVQVLWRSSLGVVCLGLYHIQDLIFGSGTDLSTALAKMCVDQFIWTPCFMAPLDALFYFWLSRNFSIRRCVNEWPQGFYEGVVLPNLLTGWCIGIPTNLMVYFFPLDLRIVAVGLIGSFWSLVCIQIGRRSGRRPLR